MNYSKKLLLSSLLIPSLIMGSKDSCTIRLTGQLVQDILNAINIIGPTVNSIQITVNIINEALASCCAQLNSRIDLISFSALDTISGLDAIETCCATINSKIGTLQGPGTCLDSLIDVPEDINNLNLTVIQLLKTILLELRGCSPC